MRDDGALIYNKISLKLESDSSLDKYIMVMILHCAVEKSKTLKWYKRPFKKWLTDEVVEPDNNLWWYDWQKYECVKKKNWGCWCTQNKTHMKTLPLFWFVLSTQFCAGTKKWWAYVHACFLNSSQKALWVRQRTVECVP